MKLKYTKIATGTNVVFGSFQALRFGLDYLWHYTEQQTKRTIHSTQDSPIIIQDYSRIFACE